METTLQESGRRDGVFKRAMLLCGLVSVLYFAANFWGLFFLPRGLMRGVPAVLVGEMATRTGSFWPHMGLTLLINLGMAAVLVGLLNLARVRRFPLGYVYPLLMGVFRGLVVGTDSFAPSDLTRSCACEGTAYGLLTGGLVMLCYVLVAAATADLTILQCRSWRRWSGEGKPTTGRRFRDLRLTRSEIVTVAIAVFLFLVAAYLESFGFFAGD